MKTLIVAAIRCSLIFLVPTVTYAISAQWDLDPISGDWNTAANWAPTGVPNGPADTATFGLSHTTDLSISANTEVNGITFTPAATNPYTITASPGLTLRISDVGIANNSGMTQNFVTAADASGNIGKIVFSHNATAGSNVSISNKGGSTGFFDRSTSDASISNEEGGTTNFFDRSTCMGIDLDRDSIVRFANNSTAANSTIDTFFTSHVEFLDHSTAGSARIRVVDGSFLDFFDTSTAGSASILAFGGIIGFSGSSRGGTAQIDLESPGGTFFGPPPFSIQVA